MIGIKKIQFNVLSKEKIEKLSVVEVNEANLYKKGIPNVHTCMDLRLGTSDRRMRCSTCRHSSEHCAGHTGHIDLAVPIVSWLFMDTVVKVLRSVCFFCSSSIADVEDASIVRRFAYKVGGKRLSAISAFCKGKKCPSCQGSQPEWKKDGLLIKARWPNSAQFESEEEAEYAKRPMTGAFLRNILKYIPEAHAKFLGVRSPENMILEKLIVPPVNLRPTSALSDGSRVKGHDDLTLTLKEIVKDNEKIKRDLEQGKPVPAKELEGLILSLISYLDKDGGVGSQNLSLGGTGVARVARKHVSRSGPQMSLGRRLAGKRGRFRGTITGKRCDYTSRSVITPEPTLDIWELAVPTFVAQRQTVECNVTPFNIELLRECVRRGDRKEGGGAHSIITPEGSKIHLGMAKDLDILAQTLSVNYKVRRHLRTGDWAIFNRQPTLHKMGMQGHRVVVRDQSTFGLPVPCTPAYNADFDGDEMNLHVVQSLSARAEIREIMAVPHQLISAKDSKPCMMPVQDTVIGSYILSSMDTFLDKSLFFDLTMSVRYSTKRIPEPAIRYRNESGDWECLYTGAQMISYLTPNKINFERAVRDFAPEGDRIDAGFNDPEQRLVVVQDGDLLMGRLCKATVGGVSNGFIQRIHYMHGAWKAAEWISDLQRMIANWFPSHGFSIGLEDCIPSKEIEEKISIVVQRSIEAIKNGSRLAREMGVSEARIEQQRMRVAASVMSQSARVILNNVDRKNNILQCIQSGAKGKSMNIAQILGVLGQQIHSGKRIHNLYDPKNRTLSCYDENDLDDPLSHGLVTGSYRDGLDVQSYFFHCMTGREGLIDTACKTAETGYLQRRLVKILESVHVASDGSVRDGEGNIVCTRYAGDGMDTEKLVHVPLSILKKKGDPLRICEKWCGGAGEEANLLCRVYSRVREIMNKKNTNNGKLTLPFDADAEIPAPSSMVARCISWGEMKDVIEEACVAIANIVGERRSIMHMELSLRASLTCRRLGRVSLASVKHAIRNIVRRVEKAKIEAGASVGTIAATSIGEPATQMTLNTFHSAGTGNITVAKGVPRFKELIDLSKNCATPSMRIFLNPKISGDRSIATKIATDISCKLLRDYVAGSSVIEDPDPCTTHVEEDKVMVEVHSSLSLPIHKVDWSRWVARIVIDKEKMLQSNLSMGHVRSSLRASLGEKVQIITSQDADDVWVCRMRMCKTSHSLKLEKMKNGISDSARSDLEKMATDEIMVGVIDSCRIAGMASIKTALVSKCGDEFVIDTDGSSLEEILYSGDLVDYRRSFSNSVHESYKCLGVEASRNVVWKETQDVINDSGEISTSHLSLLAERMHTIGFPVPVTRHGMKRSEQGVLVSASFERTVDTFLHAAVHSETDNAQGVTESIVMGRLHNMGTGHVKIINDDDMMKRMESANRQMEGTAKLCAPPRFIGRRKGRRAKEGAETYWQFTSDPIHLLHAVQSKRRVFTPPPSKGENSPGAEDSDVPMTPPDSDDEGSNLEEEDEEHGRHHQHEQRSEGAAAEGVPEGSWSIEKIMIPHTPLWQIHIMDPIIIQRH